MRLFAKLSIGALLTISASSALAWFFWYKPKFAKEPSARVFRSKNIEKNSESFYRLSKKGEEAKEYALENHFNSTRCFLIDMHISSGSKRFFVYNMEKDSVEAGGLVTHGSGSGNGEGLSFSNVPNSNATSVGKYRIGKPYQGKFGLAYKLYGLDATNSKAFERFVVLHSHACVPNEEVNPLPICESWGCPTVAPAFLNILKGYIDHSAKPMLMWIYY